jgi:hypothetical protein
VGEVTVAEMTAKRAHGIGHSGDKYSARSKRSHNSIEGLNDFSLGQMFQQVSCGYRSQLAASCGEKITVISPQDLIETCLVRERYLFGTDVYTYGFVSLFE